MRKNVLKRASSVLLALVMVIGLLPATAWALIMPRSSDSHYSHTCGNSIEVNTFQALKTALEGNTYSDIIVTGDILMSGTISVNGTKHLYAAENGSFTLKRDNNTSKDQTMFAIQTGDHLILGYGRQQYDTAADVNQWLSAAEISALFGRS